MDIHLHPQRPHQTFDPYSIPIRRVAWHRPMRWLTAGWDDLRRAPRFSLGFGLLFSIIGLALFEIAARTPQFLLAATSGFLIVAPVLGIAFYEAARQHEAGRPLDFDAMRAHLQRRWRPLAVFGLLLASFFFAWNLLTMALVARSIGSVDAGSLDALVREVMLSSRHPVLSMVWIVSGGLLAALSFVVSEITAPLLLDREIGLERAVATSLAAVAENRAAMGFWAFCLATLSFAGMLPWMLGVAVTMPWLAYASWHAYRDLTT